MVVTPYLSGRSTILIVWRRMVETPYLSGLSTI